jgi:glycosyltransferase involved in cell wall biosynthesis
LTHRFSYSAWMLSVVIETHTNADALATTLASLVGAAVDGVVREVIVCDTGSCAQTYAIAEHAGCRYLSDTNTAVGVSQAKSDWLLLLEPGARLLDGWMDVVTAHVGATTQAARFTCTRQSRPSLLQRWRQGRRPLRNGLVITKREALAGKGVSAAEIAKAATIRRLDAEIVAAPL